MERRLRFFSEQVKKEKEDAASEKFKSRGELVALEEPESPSFSRAAPIKQTKTFDDLDVHIVN